MSLDDILKEQNIVGIEGVDTRSLVSHVRSKGAMNCLISSEILDPEVFEKEINGMFLICRGWNWLLL
jgi:carbamoyl-phosphate synthase small subunit